MFDIRKVVVGLNRVIILGIVLVIISSMCACGAIGLSSSESSLPQSSSSESSPEAADESSASSEAPAPGSEGPYMIHSLSRGGSYGLIDTNGKMILEPEYLNAQPLFDTVSGEPKYVMATKTGYTDSQPAIMTALFNLNGNILQDFAANVNYFNVFGQYIVKSDGWTGVKIINAATGQPIEGLGEYTSVSMTPNRILLTRQNETIDILDYDFNTLATLNGMTWAWGTQYLGQWFISSSDNTGRSWLYDNNGELFLHFAYTGISTCGDDYLILSTDDGQSIVYDRNWKQIYSSDKRIIGFFGESLLVQDQLGDQMQCYLSDLEGNHLTKSHNDLWLGEAYVKDGKTQYVMQLSDYNVGTENGMDIREFTIFDPDGLEIYHYRGPGYINCIAGLIFVQTNYDIQLSAASVYDYEGNAIVPEGKYAAVNPMYVNNYSQFSIQAPVGYLDAIYYTPQGVMQHNLLDRSGNVILSNLKEIRFFDGHYIEATKGFYTGLMDLEGNWVYKESIFSSIEGDD